MSFSHRGMTPHDTTSRHSREEHFSYETLHHEISLRYRISPSAKIMPVPISTIPYCEPTLHPFTMIRAVTKKEQLTGATRDKNPTTTITIIITRNARPRCELQHRTLPYRHAHEVEMTRARISLLAWRYGNGRLVTMGSPGASPPVLTSTSTSTSTSDIVTAAPSREKAE